MTVRNTQPHVIYQGNGSTTQWDIPFPFLNKENISAFLIDEKDVKTALLDNFEIDEENKIFIYPQSDIDVLPLPAQQRLLLQRKTPLAQETKLLAQQTFDPHILEQGYDKAMMIAQELAAELELAVKLPLGSNQNQTDAGSYLLALEHAKQDVEQANSVAQQSLSVANSAAQTAVQASQQATQAVNNLQHYADTSSTACAAAQQARQEVSQMQTYILQMHTEIQNAARETLDAAEQVEKAEVTIERTAQDLQTAQTSAAQSAQSAKASQESAAASVQELLSMQESLNNKADCDLGNARENLDFVVDQFSDENGNWYRIYKSGWVEQGGRNNTSREVSLLLPMQNTQYMVLCVQKGTSAPTELEGSPRAGAISTTQIYINGGAGNIDTVYYVCGQGAE